MSKKKKKKKYDYYYYNPVVSDSDMKYMLSGVDKTIDNSYKSLLNEIKSYQLDIEKFDKAAEEKQRNRQIKKDIGIIPYYCKKDQVKARRKVLEEMEARKTFDRIELAFKNIIPVVIIIAKLVAALITSILGFKTSLGYINPVTLGRMTAIKNMASTIAT